MKTPYNALMILGPTAAGKTRLAACLAARYSGEIISADSRQVFRGMDIGSGKDLDDYVVNGATVPYHCVDIADPHDEYNVYLWQQEVYRVFPLIMERHHLPVFCGGTGMYLDAIVRRYALVDVPTNESLRKELSGKSMEELQAYLLSLKTEHTQDDLFERHRLLRAIEIAVAGRTTTNDDSATAPNPVVPFIIGVRFDRADLRERIALRLTERLDHGLIEEVTALLNDGVPRERLERFGLEYRFVSEYIHGVIPSREELFDRLFIAIRQFAKRQDTWFRGMERKGVVINWLEANHKNVDTLFDRACSFVDSLL